MSAELQSPPRSFWIISVIALLWNAIGVVTYLATVMMSEATLAMLPEADQALQANVPVLVTAAYAFAVHAGTLASVLLLLRRKWAIPLFVASLAGILVQMGYGLAVSDLIELKGLGAAVLPAVIVGVAVYLATYSRKANANGWLK
ncbi:MAG: hypothetical protein ACI9W4_001207 [Rhodothermales bacterium]|jgi:hypothetical protein